MARLTIMAVVFLCYAMVESKPRYQYADFPVVNDQQRPTANDLSRLICYYSCEAANNGRTEKFGCETFCCAPEYYCFW